MEKVSISHRIIAVIMVAFLVFQSMPEINSHTFSTGFSNVHQKINYTCFGAWYYFDHFAYECGKPFHLE